MQRCFDCPRTPNSPSPRAAVGDPHDAAQRRLHDRAAAIARGLPAHRRGAAGPRPGHAADPRSPLRRLRLQPPHGPADPPFPPARPHGRRDQREPDHLPQCRRPPRHTQRQHPVRPAHAEPRPVRAPQDPRHRPHHRTLRPASGRLARPRLRDRLLQPRHGPRARGLQSPLRDHHDRGRGPGRDRDRVPRRARRPPAAVARPPGNGPRPTGPRPRRPARPDGGGPRPADGTRRPGLPPSGR